MEIDSGHKNLNELISIFCNLDLSSSNEAETRKKVIDDMLEKVLGWDSKHDIHYEVRISEDGETKFADYLVTTATTSILIEAKKAGQAFSLPINKTSGIMGGVLSEGAVGEAIRQVRDYARKSSVPYAIATNGASWIIFPAIRTDRVPFDKTRAIIFRGLDDIKERFVEFWELLSRQRVVEGSIESKFFKEEKSPSKRRLISILSEPGYRLGRNSVYEYIEPAVVNALTDEALLNDKEALDACYVKSSERVKYDSRLRMYISDNKPVIDRKIVRPRKRKESRQLEESLRRVKSNLPQFLLLLGPVGAGKTTFLHYTRIISAAEVINNKVVWLYIDFKRATKNDNPREFFYRELLRLIEEDKDFNLGSWEHTISFAYQPLIEKLKTGSLFLLYNSNRDEFNKRIADIVNAERERVEPYVDAILSYVSNTFPVFLIVDNVDQLESEDYQQEVFIEAQATARKIKSSVIMSLRDITYLKHRNKPTFDAFQIDTIYIDPPSVLPVVSRRLIYAKKCIDGHPATIVSESGIRFQVENLGVFFEIVGSSLLEGDSGYLIEVISSGDIRRALAFIRSFLSSAHASADKALQTYLSKGEYKFPPHEVFKGAILGQKKYYREEESTLANIYDAKLGTPNLQLLRLQILYRLVRFASEATYEGTTVDSIQSELFRIGVHSADVLTVLTLLGDGMAIKTTDNQPLTSESRIIPTRFGGFLIQDLSTRFEYFEPCLLDAYIYRDEVWDRLTELTHKIDSTGSVQQKIGLRIDRSRIFLDYLADNEQIWIVRCKRYKLNDNWAANLMIELRAKLEKVFSVVITSASKNYPVP